MRDRIPDIMRAAGNEPRIRVAKSGERSSLLLAKLYEECREFEADQSAAELADIIEVVYALAENMGINKESLDQIRYNKLVDRGGFAAGYVIAI